MNDRKAGIRHALSRLKNRLISRDMQDIYHYVPALSTLQPVGVSPDESSATTYQIHDGIEVLEIVERIKPMGKRGRRFALARLKVGDKVVIGTHDGTPVFYGWLMFGEIEMTYGVFLDVPSGNAFGYNLFTARSYRRHGAMSGFYRFVCQYLKQRNYHTLNVGIATKTTVSIKAHEKNGFVKSGYFYTLKVLGTCFTLARFEHAKRFYLTCRQLSL